MVQRKEDAVTNDVTIMPEQEEYVRDMVPRSSSANMMDVPTKL